MDAHTIQNFRRDLVGRQIHILLFQPHIVPDHILGLIQIFVGQIFHFKIHRRKMVAVHHQNRRLIVFLQAFCQLFDKLIHLVDLIDIIFPCVIILRLAFRPGHCDLRIFQHRFVLIIAMSLNGNGIDVIRLIRRGVQRLDDLIGQDIVLDPACRSRIGNVRHILLGSEGLKSQPGKNCPSGIEIRLVVMDRMSGISQIPQHIRRALTGFLLEDRLVRILARSKITKAHSRDRLKFRICRSGAHNRDTVPAGRIILHQLVERRDRVLGKIQIFHRLRIKKGFQLKENNVRLHRIVFLLPSFTFLNLLHQFLRISVWLIDSCLKQRHCQTVRVTVILIGKRDVYKITGKHTFFQRQIRCTHKQKHHRRYQRQIHIPTDPASELRSLEPEPYQKQEHGCQCRKRQDHRSSREIFGDHLGSVTEVLQIRSGKRRDPVGQNHTVDNTQQQPEKGHEHTCQCPSPEQIYDHKSSKNQKCIIQKNQRFFCHKRPCLRKGSAGQRLNDEIQNAAPRRMQRQGKQIADLHGFCAARAQFLRFSGILLTPFLEPAETVFYSLFKFLHLL